MTQDVINRISLSPTEKIVARATCQVSDLPKSTNVWEISGSLMKRLSRSPGTCLLVHAPLLWGVGYVFKKLDYPLAPLVLALVLGDMAENALRQSLIMSQGSLGIFFNRPIAGVITAVAIFFFLMPIITPWWRRLRGLPPVASMPSES